MGAATAVTARGGAGVAAISRVGADGVPVARAEVATARKGPTRRVAAASAAAVESATGVEIEGRKIRIGTGNVAVVAANPQRSERKRKRKRIAEKRTRKRRSRRPRKKIRRKRRIEKKQK